MTLMSLACFPNGLSAEATLPQYDISALCQREAVRAAGFGTAIFNRCIDDEQRAYDEMTARLPQIPSEHVTLCDDFSTEEVAGYARIQRCLELLSENDAPRKEFRY